MTTATSAAVARMPQPVRTPGGASRRGVAQPPALHVVPAAPWRAPLAPFILVSVTVVVAGLLALLLLNTLVAQGSFRVQKLEHQQQTLREREETLRSEVVKLQAPGVLASRAQAIGLVPGNTPAFLRLSDGRVTGVPKPAAAPPPPQEAIAALPDTIVAPPVEGLDDVPREPVAAAAEAAATPKTPVKPAVDVKPPAAKTPAAPSAEKVPAAKTPVAKTPVAKPAAKPPLIKTPIVTTPAAKPPAKAPAAKTPAVKAQVPQ